MRKKRDTITDKLVLAERAYREDGDDNALVEAEKLCHTAGRPVKRWMRAPILERDRAVAKMIVELLASCKRGYCELHMEEALDDAVRLCAQYGRQEPRWMREPLLKRARATILGTYKKRSGRPSTLERDDVVFHVIQGYRDTGTTDWLHPIQSGKEGMSLKEAVARFEADLNNPHAGFGSIFQRNEKSDFNKLMKIYKRHQRKVRLVKIVYRSPRKDGKTRKGIPDFLISPQKNNKPVVNRYWILRRFTYIPGFPGAFNTRPH